MYISCILLFDYLFRSILFHSSKLYTITAPTLLLPVLLRVHKKIFNIYIYIYIQHLQSFSNYDPTKSPCRRPVITSSPTLALRTLLPILPLPPPLCSKKEDLSHTQAITSPRKKKFPFNFIPQPGCVCNTRTHTYTPGYTTQSTSHPREKRRRRRERVIYPSQNKERASALYSITRRSGKKRRRRDIRERK